MILARGGVAAMLLASLALVACGADDSGSDAGTGGAATGGTPGAGGTNGAGGRTGSGGLTGSGGAGGSRASGGATGSGGMIASGGAPGAGGSATPTGGVTGTGGATGAGGIGGRGGLSGSSGSGGATAAGGMAGTGGIGGAGNVPGNASAVYPPPNGTNVCPDPQLRVTFAAGGAAPSIGSSGLIQVFNSTNGTVVSSVNVGASSYTSNNGGMSFTIQRPIYIDGNTVVVYLPSKPLTYGQTYYVTVSSGAIKSPSGAPFVVSGSTAWRFSTASAAPSNKSTVGVALDGAAPFCSLQGALDFVPSGNTSAVTVSVANGTYHEIVYFSSKSNITIKGASESGTIFAATNNNNLNPSTKTRAMIGADSTNGLTVTDLTIHNLTPQGGSQAEALRLEKCDKCVVTNATIISLQDTLLWSGRIYAKNDLIEGNVDFVWGTGAVYFDSSEIRTIGRSGPIVQARNPPSTYGYVFVDSKLTSDAGLTGGVLARIAVDSYPASHVAYINCQMSSEIAPVGWQITAGTNTASLRFWEYQSVNASGSGIDVSERLAGSKQLSSSEAASMRDPSVVLAGWQPPGT